MSLKKYLQNWQVSKLAKYKFDEIAFKSNDKKKPTEEDKYNYIGLEHLDPECLRVTRFGSEVAPIGEKLVMKKGDVLFGKRRAYQRKVAISPFDGIFSAHGMVLRPRINIITKELFPFFISSNQFLDAAIRISVGSLSPTINWRDLAELEFNLPPLEEQSKLAESLWAFEETKEAYKRLLAKSDELVKAQFIEMFGDCVENPMGWPMVKLNDISDYYIGLTYKPSDIAEDGVTVLRSGNIQSGNIDLSDIVKVNTTIKEKMFLKKDDILMCSRNGSSDLVGKVAKIPNLSEKMTFGAFMTIIRSDYPDYLLSFFQMDAFRAQITSAKTTTINQITKAMLDQILIPKPPLELQNNFASFTESVNKSKYAIQGSLKSLEQCRNALMEKVFG